MAAHGIRNRSPHAPRVSATSLTPQAPSGRAFITAAVLFCATVAVWVVAVLFVFSL